MVDIQLVYKLIIIFLYSYFATVWSMRYVMKKLKKFGYTVRDMYKRGKRKIPTMGGIGMLVGILVSISLSQILLTGQDLGRMLIFYFIVIVYALFGTLDDMFKFHRRYDKIIFVLILSFPIASLITDTRLDLLGYSWELGWAFGLVLAPVYIMVIANLINLHAGYNGLVTGLSWIILLFIGIKSLMVHGLANMLFLLPVFGALTAFLWFNMYPARAHDGNIGAFLLGGAIGGLLLVNNLEKFGIFILMPHVINFVMDTWTIVIRKRKDVKFGRLRKDRTIEAPPTMKYKSLKFLICSWFRLTEKQAVWLLYIPTIVFGIIGLFIF